MRGGAGAVLGALGLALACGGGQEPLVMELVWESPAACPEGKALIERRLARAGLGDDVIVSASGKRLTARLTAQGAEAKDRVKVAVQTEGGVSLWTVDESRSDPPSGEGRVRPVEGAVQHEGAWLVLGEKVLGPEHIADAVIEDDPYQGTQRQKWTLTAEGTARFSDATAAHVGQRIAVLSGGDVLMAPVVQERISGGVLTIVPGAGQTVAEVPMVEAVRCGFVLAEERVVVGSGPLRESSRD